MSTVSDAGKKEKSRVFETVLSSPGMSESCKISLKMSRQNILLLGRLIEAGILDKNGVLEDEILGNLPEQPVADFKLIHEDILKKAGLSDFYEKLKTL